LVIKQLIGYDWPGNVRELRNIVERLVVTAIDDLIGVDDLPTPLAVTVPKLPDELSLDARLRNYEQALIEEAMRRFGTTRAAAQHLGISQSAVVRKLKKR
jgi:transcriptional regulator with PAS, ATPase and Fis domain